MTANTDNHEQVQEATATAVASGDERELFTFRVEGSEEVKTALPTNPHPFDETYEIAGEHPAEALAKLVNEIEWGILDGYEEFTITLVPVRPGGVS